MCSIIIFVVFCRLEKNLDYCMILDFKGMIIVGVFPNLVKQTARFLFIFFLLQIVLSIIHHDEVNAAATQSFVVNLDEASRTQYREITLPNDFKSLIGVTTNTGSILTYTLDEAQKKLKVTVGNGSKARTDYIYNGLVTGSNYSGGYCSGTGYLLWDGSQNYYNAEYTVTASNNSSPGYSNGIWYSMGKISSQNNLYGISYSYGLTSGCPGGSISVSFRGYTSQTPVTSYQYAITVNYSTNTSPEINLTTTGNQTLSDQSENKIITISGTARDIDAGNTLTISAAINGKTKTTTLTEATSAKPWTLTWDVIGDGITAASYNSIVVSVNDGVGGTSSATYSGTIRVERVTSLPVITSPNGGEVIDSNFNITWLPAIHSDISQNNLRYEIGLSTDGGTSWTTIVPLTSAGANSFNYNFSDFVETSNAKIRIRAYDGSSYGGYAQADKTFTIRHRYYNDFFGKISVSSTDSSITATGLSNLPGQFRYKISNKTSDWLTTDKTIQSTIINNTLYDTSGNGSRKLIRLNNGWFVASLINGTNNVTFYLSKDNGSTWQQLCWTSAAGTLKVGIASIGTKVYAAVSIANDTKDYLYSFDAATVQNVMLNPISNPDTGQTAYGDISIAADSSGALHATWASKNSTYPNSFNVRYSKSTDGGLTWSAAVQITTTNTLNMNWTSPAIIISKNNPVIITQWSDSTNQSYGIYSYSYNGSAWSSNRTIYNGGSYPQSSPSVATSSNGQIWAAWEGRDSVDTTKTNIHTSYSDDGGFTWSPDKKITSGNLLDQKSPSVSIDKDGKVHIVFKGIVNNYFDLRKVTYDGSTWSAIMNLTSNTTNGVDAPSTLIDPDFSSNYIESAVIYKDSQTNSVKFRSRIPIETNYTVSDLQPNTRYMIQVEYKDLSNNIATKNIEFFTKAQKPTLSVEDPTGSTADVSITDFNPEKTQYQILVESKYVTSKGALSTTPTWIAVPNKKMTVSGLDSGKQYTFQIKARNTLGEETPIASAITTTLSFIPEAPRNIKSMATSDQVTLTWDAVENATGYEIEIDSGLIIDNGPNLSYIHPALLPNSTHYYRIRVKQGTIVGKWSPQVMVSTKMAQPSLPVNVVINAFSTSVVVTWDKSSDAVAYEIEVDGQIKSVGSKTTYQHNGLIPGSHHTYRIRSKNAAGNGNWSPLQSVLTLQNAPMFPSNITTLASNKSIVLTWDPVVDAEGYEIEADGILIDNGISNFTKKSGLLPNSTHTYRVRAKSSAGTSGWSETVTATTYLLDTPEKILDMATDASISLTWGAITDAERYEIEVDGNIIGSEVTTSYVHNGLSPELTHSYRIRAISSNGMSSWSLPISVSTLPKKPTVPQSVYAQSGIDTVTLSWDPVQGATGYDVEVDGKATLDNLNGTFYTDTDLNPVSDHAYRIRAKNEAVEGDWSQVISVTTLAGTPKAPNNIYLTSSTNIVTIHWDAEPGATGYEIEVDGQIIYVGPKTEYKHRRILTGTEHQYRIRTLNPVGISEWGNLVVNNTIQAKLTKGKTVDLGLTASDVTDFSKYTLTVSYDPNAIDVVDLSILTEKIEHAAGRIEGTDITITDFKAGRITFVSDKAITLGESWTGVINSIKFKARYNGGTSITYTVVAAIEQ